SMTSSNQPGPVAGGLQFIAISAGDLHTCGVLVGGRVACWGAGDKGQLGYGGTSDSSSPIQVPGIQNAVAVSAGNGFSCVLIVDGSVRCWGDKRANHIGDGGAEMFSIVPKPVSGFIRAVSISTGISHACAVIASGLPFCWGSNLRGQIGNN